MKNNYNNNNNKTSRNRRCTAVRYGSLSLHTQIFIAEWTRMRDLNTRQCYARELPMLHVPAHKLPPELVLPGPALPSYFFLNADLFVQPITRVLSEYHPSPGPTLSIAPDPALPEAGDKCAALCLPLSQPPSCHCPAWANRLMACMVALPTRLFPNAHSSSSSNRVHPCRTCAFCAEETPVSWQCTDHHRCKLSPACLGSRRGR